SCPPLATFERCFHELITHPHAQIFILVHDRAVRVAVVTAVVTLLDQRPRFFFFFLLRVNEFRNVGMPILECVHLGGTPRFAAALHPIRNLIINLRNESGPLGLPPPLNFSLVDLREERSVPVPLPYLKSIASLVASRIMSSIVSSTL